MNKQKYILLEVLKKEGLIDLLNKNHAVIAGGAIRAVFANEHISDYDIYFKTKRDLDSFLIDLEETEFVEVMRTGTAITFKKNEIKLQVITMEDFITHPEKIIKQFDYTVCMGAYDFDTDSFVLYEDFLENLARRELYYNVSAEYPLASLFRLRKYFKKGYTISGTEVIKLGLAINNLKMESYLDLKKQLEGIDTLFLKELTDKLLSPEYAEKKYDFNTFLELLEEHFQDKLDEVFGE